MPKLTQRPANPYPIVHLPRPREFPFSAGQQLVWWHDRLDPARGRQDHVIGGWRVAEGLDRQTLSSAVAMLVGRHEILRTRFVLDSDGVPVQQVVEDVRAGITWAGEDWRQAVDQAVAEPFDLAQPPLYRLVAADLGRGGSGLFLSMHHIIADRWSMDVLARDLFELNAAVAAGRDARLPELAVQYGDYALWQRRFLNSDLIGPQLSYWKQVLAGHTRLELSPGRPPSATHDTVGREVVLELSAESTDALAAMAWRSRASPAIVVTAALCAVLATLADEPDVVCGAIVSDRPRPELQDVIGYFLNTVALRVRLSPGTPPFREVVRRTRDAWMTANANQDVPFDQIVTALKAGSGEDRAPAFGAVVNHGGGWPGAERADTPPQWDPGAPGTATFELSLGALMLNTLMVDGRLRVAFVYDPSLLDDSLIATVASRYVSILEQGVADPDRPLSPLGAQ